MERQRTQGPQTKLSFKNLLVLFILGAIIISIKIYFMKEDRCHNICTNINSELDVIRCLDACALNGNDFIEPITYKKIITIFLLVIVLSYLLYKFIIHFIIKKDWAQKILQLLEKMKLMKDRLFNGKIQDDFSYKKFDDN